MTEPTQPMPATEVKSRYVLGSDEAEIARLDAQAAAIAPATALPLRADGIAPEMRVLDLGTGLGHVSLQVAEPGRTGRPGPRHRPR